MSYAYDAAGRVARERRPSGRTVVNAHSPSGLLLSARFWALGAAAPAEEREFRHDACGRVVWARDGEGESTYAYDPCGRPTPGDDGRGWANNAGAQPCAPIVILRISPN